MALLPRLSGEYIVKRAKFLKVHESGIDKLKNEIIEGLKTKVIDIANFSQNDFHPKIDAWAVDWIFLVDTLNFCFWTEDSQKKWTVQGHTGYFALCSAINRAIKEGVDITNPKFYSNISTEQLSSILRSDDGLTHIPLLDERVFHLRESGKTLVEKYEGKFENCVKLCNHSAQKLLTTVVSEFPSYKDEAEYNGQRVSLYKRAQILIGDIWACFKGSGLGRFDDIDTITMFADYRVPQVLVHFGCLEYSDELMGILEKGVILRNGCEMEVEIRGASIYIVEEVKKKIIKEIAENNLNIARQNVNSILLDHFLWDYRRKFAKELAHIPFHKVLCIYY